jgi:hormone-sensitive lipase
MSNNLATLGKSPDFSLNYIKEYVQVRILSKISIPKLRSKNSKAIVCEKLIIHAHGGGYLAMSSFSHQSYLRTWANKLPVPIFSIDYRLSPEFPFPAALDDIWQLYTWIVNYAESSLNIIPNKIVLVGDSAGGNLISALALKAIEANFRIPDALLLIYPNPCRDFHAFSKSSLIAYENEILPGSVFSVMYKSYPSTYPHSFYLISPVNAPLEVLKFFPKTEFMLPLNDSLFYHSFRFADRLLVAGADVKIKEYPDTIHAALNFGNKNTVPLLYKFVEDAIEILKNLLED